jgi:glucose-6-phosphate isomerase/transaldolase/glucose-6-phosphate isomerase
LSTFQSTGRLPEQTSHSAKDAAKDLSGHLKPGTYVAILAYTTPSRSIEAAVRRLRQVLMSQHQVATTFGYGPRYLHSTGQLHKGGPNTGVFLELVDRMALDVAIPNKPFSFGTLAQAQAVGDIESLHAHDRYAVRVTLGRDQAATVTAITAALKKSPAKRASKPKPRRAGRRR